MLAEKLLLHILIILVPILLFSFFQENRKVARLPDLYGVMLALASILCLMFPYEQLGFYWDLRNIPLIIAFLYGGRRAGWITMGSILCIRTYIGGDALLFGYLNCLLTVILPILVSRRFMLFSPGQRIKKAVLVSIWPMFVSLSSLLIYLTLQNNLMNITIGQTRDIALFGVIYLAGSWFAIMLNEAILERNLMKENMIRSGKMNILSEMAASIAHEVRNPLTVVKGFIQLMQEKEDTSKRFIPILMDELNRAEAILNDYLSYAKPQLKKVETFDLSDFLQSICVLLNPLSIKAGVSLEYKVEEGIFLTTDKSLLQQAIINLIKNAIEATNEGGFVKVVLNKELNRVRIGISDTGRGMNEDQLKRLGTPYYSTKEKGTGLGTSVSIRLVEMMGGNISFRSKPNIGTNVVIIFPK